MSKTISVAAIGIAVLSASSVSATSSISGMRKRQPTLVATSQHTVPELAACFSTATEKYGLPPNFTPTPTGGQIALQSPRGWSKPWVAIVIDIVDRTSDREVTVWQMKTIFDRVNKSVRSKLQDCLA